MNELTLDKDEAFQLLSPVWWGLAQKETKKTSNAMLEVRTVLKAYCQDGSELLSKVESQTWCLWIEDWADNAFPAIRRRKPLSCCLCDCRLQRFEHGPESRWRQWSQYKGLCPPSKLHLTFPVWAPHNTPQGPLLSLLPSSHLQTPHTRTFFTLPLTL